jgi:hypothetical protein
VSTPEPKKDLPKLLEFTVDAVTASELTLKVKNISGAVLDKTLAIEIYPLMSLVSAALNDAATKAPDNDEPPGALRLDGIVTGPNGWSLWARRESSDSTMVVVLINDRRQDTGAGFTPPVALPAASETTIRIPLSPQAAKDNIQLGYSYTHGGADERRDGTLDLNATHGAEPPPEVLLYTTHPNPTMVKAGELVPVLWTIKDGVSATLFGPLPGDNAKLELGTKTNTDFKIESGALTVRVVGLMNYVLEAQVKRTGKADLLVKKMLTLDTANNKHVYINPRQRDVLPYGLIELDWAAWGVSTVRLRAGSVTTRVIKLTQQTFGGSYEGSGVMRLSALETGPDTVSIEATPDRSDKNLTIVRWRPMTKPDIAGVPLGLAMVGSKMALLTYQGLYVAEVGKTDPSTPIKKLPFVKKTDTAQEWIALTAVGTRFLVLKRTSPDIQVAAYAADGTPDAIPPLSLPPDVKRLVSASRVFFDFVGFGPRAYIVIEAPIADGRRAYSVAFNTSSNRAELRPEPLLENLPGYRLTTFDEALYALHRDSGRMFRFELIKGVLGPALQAARAVKKVHGQDTSMVANGLLVPLGHALVVFNPTSVPSLESLEQYDLHNVLRYDSSAPTSDDEDDIPQDLFYTPQKNYWGRCGHDLNIKPGAVAFFREGEAPRLWVIQPDGQTDTLAVGSESLFVRDYVLDFPTKPLSPYLNKKRRFTIKHSTAVGPVDLKYRNLGINDVVTSGPREIVGIPNRPTTQFDLEIGYNEANPAPVIIRFQLARRLQANPEVDYLLELSFSGPNLSTVSSCINRVIAVQSTLLVSNDEIDGSRTQHSADSSVIEVPKPARLDELFGFKIVNSSDKFRVKIENLRIGPTYVIDNVQFAIKSDFSSFLLKFEGRVATEGVVTVGLNYALPVGIEVLGSSQPQTKLVRIANDKAQKIEVKAVRLWKPGDPPVQMEGTNQTVLPESPVPVFICQLDYKM